MGRFRGAPAYHFPEPWQSGLSAGKDEHICRAMRPEAKVWGRCRQSYANVVAEVAALGADIANQPSNDYQVEQALTVASL
jgi:hypothetical protein